MTRKHPKSPTSQDPSNERGDATREALILAGVELFAQKGFHAASSRALAEAAGVNQALIGYHFGGKRGLYLAVFEHIGTNISQRLAPAAVEIRAPLQEMEKEEPNRELLLDALLALIDRAIELFASPETETWAMLIVREQQNPSDAFDLVWNQFMSRLSGLLVKLVAALRGQSTDEPQVRLLVLTMISQPLFFRVARETTMRLTGWEAIGANELAAIKSRIHQNIHAMLTQEDL